MAEKNSHILEKDYHPYLALLCMKQSDIAEATGIPYHTLNSLLKKKHKITPKNKKKLQKFHTRYIGRIQREFDISMKSD